MPGLSTPSPNPQPASASSDTPPSIDSPPTLTPRPFPTRPLTIALFVACPILILFPPRKLDLYTFSLSTAWAVSAQKLYVMHSHEFPTWMGRHRPTAAITNEERADEKWQSIVGKSKPGEREERGGVVGMARRLWMGKEEPGWYERQEKEDREKLVDGESYAGLIGDAIMEAFGATKETEEDAREDTNKGKSENDG